MRKLFANRKILYPLLLCCFTLGAFFPALLNGFVYDDHFQLVRNPYVKDFRHLPALFTTDVWHFSPETQSNNYRPLHMVTYLVVYKLFGLDPFVFHLMNLLLHLCSVLLLWQVLGHYIDEFQAFIGSLLFATHPVHVEPVAWIGGTPEVLYSAFLMVALLLYLRKAIYWSLIPFAAALLTKEPAIVFPGILVVEHWLYRRYPNRKFLYWLFAATSVILLYVCARIYALDSFVRFNQVKMDLFHQLYTAIIFAGIYATKVLCPVDLKVFYHFRLPMDANHIRTGLMMVAALILMLVANRKNRSALFGILCFGILIVPSLFIVGVSPVLFAERYVYLASAGLILAIVSFPLKKTIRILLIVLCVVFAIMTFSRSALWKDDSTLWTKAYLDSPDSYTVNYNLATNYFKRGDCEHAITFYERAVMLQPDLAGAYYNLANCYYRLGRYEESARNLTQFLKYLKADDGRRQEATRKLDQLKQRLPAR